MIKAFIFNYEMKCLEKCKLLSVFMLLYTCNRIWKKKKKKKITVKLLLVAIELNAQSFCIIKFIFCK